MMYTNRNEVFMLEEKKFAVLIDADNITAKYIGSILNEISNKGTITYKRIYGDWTSTNANNWKKVLLQYSITPIQQYSYTYGKNSTDSAMIIDAMDILYTGDVDGFALASSDSDFTRLAVRLREAGKTVIGLGESKTPAPFCASCNEFKFLDRITDDEEKPEAKAPKAKARKTATEKANTKVSAPVEAVDVLKGNEAEEETAITDIRIIEESLKDIIIESGDEGYGIDIGELGSRLQKRHPDFDTRNYGYSKFSIFLKKFDFLSLEHNNTSYNIMLKPVEADRSLENRLIELVRSHGERGVNPGILSSEIRKEFPNFNPKEYGYTKFEQYIRSLDVFDVKNVTPTVKKITVKK